MTQCSQSKQINIFKKTEINEIEDKRLDKPRDVFEKTSKLDRPCSGRYDWEKVRENMKYDEGNLTTDSENIKKSWESALYNFIPKLWKSKWNESGFLGKI